MNKDGGGKMKEKSRKKDVKPYSRDSRKSILGKIQENVLQIVTPSWLGDLLSSAKKPMSSQHVKKSEAEADEVVGQNGGSALQSSSPQSMSMVSMLTPAQHLTPVQHLTAPNFSQKLLNFDVSRANEHIVAMNEPLTQPHSNAPLQSTGRPITVPAPVFNRSSTFESQSPGQSTLHGRGLGGVEPSSVQSRPEEYSQLSVSRFSASVDEDPEVGTPHSEPQLPAASPAFFFLSWDKPSPGSSHSQNNTVLGHRLSESLYYPGRSRYGGRWSVSSSNRSAFGSPYTPGTRERIRPTTGSAAKPAHNSTSRRILRALEATAQQANQEMNSKIALNAFTPASYKRNQLATDVVGRLLAQPRAARGPPVRSQGLFHNPPVEKTQKDVPVPASDPQTHLPSDTTRAGGKMKVAPVTRKHGRAVQSQDEVVEAPDLPMGVTLQLKSMPQLNFGAGFSQAKPPLSVQPLPTAPSLNTSAESAESVGSRSSEPLFAFSSPIRRARSESGGCLATVETEDFTFQSPLKIASPSNSESAKKQKGSNLTPQSSPMVGNPFQAASKLSSGSVLDVLQSGTTAEVNSPFGAAKQLKSGSERDSLSANSSTKITSPFGPAKQLSSGSVMDILSAANSSTKSADPASSPIPDVNDIAKSANTPVEYGAATSTVASQWSCTTCLVKNSAERSTCECCGASKPIEGGSGTKPPSTQAKSNDGGSGTKPPSAQGSQWTCSACLVKNEASDTSCACCSTPGPAAAGVASAATSGFTSAAAISKVANTSWTCDICLLSNDPDETACVACTTPKPGAKPPAVSVKSSSSSSSFKFGGTLPAASGTVQFGLPAAVSSSTKPVNFGGTTSSDSQTTVFGGSLKSNSGPLKFGGSLDSSVSKKAQFATTESTAKTVFGGVLTTNSTKVSESLQSSFGGSISDSEASKTSDSIKISFGCTSETSKALDAPNSVQSSFSQAFSQSATSKMADSTKNIFGGTWSQPDLPKSSISLQSPSGTSAAEVPVSGTPKDSFGGALSNPDPLKMRFEVDGKNVFGTTVSAAETPKIQFGSAAQTSNLPKPSLFGSTSVPSSQFAVSSHEPASTLFGKPTNNSSSILGANIQVNNSGSETSNSSNAAFQSTNKFSVFHNGPASQQPAAVSVPQALSTASAVAPASTSAPFGGFNVSKPDLTFGKGNTPQSNLFGAGSTMDCSSVASSAQVASTVGAQPSFPFSATKFSFSSGNVKFGATDGAPSTNGNDEADGAAKSKFFQFGAPTDANQAFSNAVFAGSSFGVGSSQAGNATNVSTQASQPPTLFNMGSSSQLQGRTIKKALRRNIKR